MKQTKVLVVDDDPQFRRLMTDLLCDEYEISCCETGKSAIDSYTDVEPDIMLLDVHIGDIDGFTVCQEIKKIDSFDNSSVIFVSGLDCEEERLKAYEVGAWDYVSKPIKLDEFRAKIHTIERIKADKQDAVSREQHSREMAFESMKEAAQYGMLVQFLKQSFSSNTPNELAANLFNMLEKLGLSGCVQFRTDKGNISWRKDFAECSPIEEKLFSELRDIGRIYEFKNRTIFNDKHVSILIKDMPHDDSVAFGRYKDIFALIVEGMDARIMDILRQETIVEIINDVNNTTGKLEDTFISHEKHTLDIIESFFTDMHKAMHTLHLSLEQEEHLMRLTESCMEKLIHLNGHGREIDSFFEELVNHLKFFSDEQ